MDPGSRHAARDDVQRALDAAGKRWQGRDWKDRCGGVGVHGLKLEHVKVAVIEKVEWRAVVCHVLDSLLDTRVDN